jgi:hypothetical protein
MNNKWRNRLTESLYDNNAVHNTTTTCAREETLPTGPGPSQKSAQVGTAKTAKTHSEAEDRGLVATWATTFGFVAIHDPLTGEWHDVKTKEAPGWAIAEAGLRKRLYKGGDRRAYAHSAKKMQEVWESEHPPTAEEGIVEEFAPDAEDQQEDFS